MKKTLMVVSLLLAIWIPCFVTKTASAKAGITDKRKIRIIDYHGREKEIQLPVNRIILLVGPAALQVFHILNATDKVVGVNNVVRESKYIYPKLHGLPIVSVSGSATQNYEAILSLEPDLVLAAFWADPDLEKILGSVTQVVRFDIGRPLTYSNDVRTLARIVGGMQKAEEFISWYETIVNSLQNKLSGIGKDQYPRVFDYYGNESGLSDGPPFGTYGKMNPWVPPLLKMAGGNSITKNLEGDWIIVDAEWAVEKNPSVIIREIASTMTGEEIIGYNVNNSAALREKYDDMMTRSPFVLSDAVKNERVHFIDCALIQSRWFLALPYLLKWLHPEQFQDLNPQQYHQEYLTRFLKIDYNLQKQGVFTFPQ